MALTTDGGNCDLSRELYRALLRGEWEEVIKLCGRIRDGPFHKLTIHDDTVLHMATYSAQEDLVLKLLKSLPENLNYKLTQGNAVGDTVLHGAAISDRSISSAKEMLLREPNLLQMRNRFGETALFRAARYGSSKMFKFLDVELSDNIRNQADLKLFHQRNDNTTILHMSILTEHFDLALSIARKYEYLVGKKDGDGMSALQLLALNPSAFKKGRTRTPTYLKQFIYSCVSTRETTSSEEGVSTRDTTSSEEGVETCCWVPLCEAIRRKKKRHESAVKLAKFLIAKDTSWKDTESLIYMRVPKFHRYGGPITSAVISTKRIAETPLFLATKNGAIEIVEEILNMFPQAVEHVDDQGRNILHVAIQYRQIHILNFVVRMEIPMMRLTRHIDNNGNSILHVVGINKSDSFEKDMRRPALLLQEDLLLFERVKKIVAAHVVKSFNYAGKTAKKMFAENNARLHSDAKEWLKRTAEHCLIVAVLIATIAFGAAYTIPGGPNQNTGYPLLLNQSCFMIFTVTDVLSLTFALTSVVTFLSIFTSPFRLKDFRRSLPHKLVLGVTLLILSVLMMMLAFAATVILMTRNKKQWTRISLYSVAFLPITIFAIAYLPVYISLILTFKYSLSKIGMAFPRFRRSTRVGSSTSSSSTGPFQMESLP